MKIRCENVSAAYENRTVFRNVTFTVRDAQYIGVIGENGTGKSTLVKVITGLIAPTQGRIVREDILPNEIGYLPQKAENEDNFPATVGEIVLSGNLNRLGLRPFFRSADRERAERNMTRLGIGHLKDRIYSELSGGQKQRVLLARALCATRKLLILDEPVTGLDPAGTAEFYRLIRQIREEDGIAVLTVSHDVENILKNADRILDLGTDPAFFGSSAQYLKTDAGKRFAEDDTNE